MAVVDIGPRLRARLASEPSTELVHALSTAHTGTLNTATERFEARLTAVCSELKADLREDIVNRDTAIRVALVEGLASIRDEMSRLRVDVLAGRCCSGSVSSRRSRRCSRSSCAPSGADVHQPSCRALAAL